MKIVPIINKGKRAAKKVRSLAKKVTDTASKVKYYYEIFSKYCEVDDRKVLLESFNGKGISDSAYAVLQEMIAQGLDKQYEIYFGSKEPANDEAFMRENNLPIKLVKIASREYAYVLATAKHLLTNTSFPAYFMRRPEQIVVNVWHGTPLKTLGKQMRLGMQSMFLAQHAFMHSSVLTFPNDFTRGVMMRDYNIEQLYTGKVAMVGYPRNSVFMREGDPFGLRERYGLDACTSFAYMPTWRGKSSQDIDTTGYVVLAKEMLAQIDKSLRDDQKMFVNFHPMVAQFITLDTYDHIFPFPTDVGTYDFLTQLDVLITDYSSVLFDFALTRKPIILFTYDEEEYLSDRGFYFPLSELPFPKVNTVEDFISLIESGSYTITDEQQQSFDERFLKYDSAENAQKVLQILLGNIPDDVEVIDYARNKEHTWQVVDVMPQKSLADLNGIFRSSDRDNDVILLRRAGFGPGKSAHVVDNYLDGYNFIFTTQSLPRTFVEEVTRRFWPPTEQRLAVRERERVFADLPTVPEAKTAVLIEEVDTSFSEDYLIPLRCSYTTDGAHVTLSLPQDGYQAKKLMLISGRTIRWIRDITDDERAVGSVTLDVADPLRDTGFKANINTRVIIALIVEEEATHATYVARAQVGEGKVGTSVQPERFSTPVTYQFAELNEGLEHDKDGGTGIPIVDKARGQNISVTPYENEDGYLSLLFTYEHQEARLHSKAMVVSAKTPQERYLTAKIKLPNVGYTVKAVEVRNRMAGVDTAYQAQFSISEHKNDLVIDMTFDPHGLVFDGIYWDLYVVVEDGAGTTFDLMCFTADSFRHSLYFRNLQCVLDDGNVIFPYYAAKGKLALCHRKLEKSDTLATKAKEWAAVGCYYALLPYWKQRRIWLVYEKFCSLAQDNGYAFFRYCMDDAPEEAKKHIYYVIKKEEPEFANVERYGKNVIDFMSFRHMLFALAADIYVGSDAKSHLYQWRPKTSVVRKLIANRKVFFLQHGVTALKRVDYLFGKKGNTPMTYFLTTSHAEQQIVVDNFGYDVRHSPVLGFSRWDVLEDTSNAQSPTILLMPTWRQWLEDVGDQAFLQSEYFKAYSELIKDERVLEVLERTNATLKFFIHPKLSEQLKHFEGKSDRVELIEMGTQPLNKLIMECSMLITDYSSVCWDVLYMDKPVLYYQFDQQQYLDEVGSYIDLNTQLPGPVCKDLTEVETELDAIASNGFQLLEKDRETASRWYDFKDRQNRQRTYEYLLSEGY